MRSDLGGGPSTDGVAMEDAWTRHCLEIAGRRAFGWVVLGAIAFVGQLLLIFLGHVPGQVPLMLLVFSVVVLGLGMARRRVPPVMADEPWRFARVHWRGGRLVVHGEPELVLDVTAGPISRGRINRHRRAWYVGPDRDGHSVVTFRGVPRLFPARSAGRSPG
ncbi:hypothetical protein [Actinosynnema sp. NPDC020468]|uniref:hypothetical protein n=1 Tax=Actinosynnema sp. NPDC020468 TaxID=3154488 RepID=UPI0033F5678B